MITLDANIWVAVYDPHDSFHAASELFLTTVGRRRLAVYGPAFITLEVGCALARRTQTPDVGKNAIQRLGAYPLLTLVPLDARLLATASELGLRHMVRGADALYVATAALTGAPLITWDAELIRRAGALSPANWLAAHPA